MDKEMTERVAKVLSPQSWAALNTPCDTKAKAKRREASLDFAKRSIAAMREPTDKIKNVVSYSIYKDSEEIWKEMIDTIIKE